MPEYTVMRFNTLNNSYIIKDSFTDTHIDTVKYYLIKMPTSNVTINFKFDTYILSNTLFELYMSPTTTSNGRLLAGLTTINIYADPTVTSDGTLAYKADTDSKFIDIHTLKLLANATYLIKIAPKDLNSTVIS